MLASPTVAGATSQSSLSLFRSAVVGAAFRTAGLRTRGVDRSPRFAVVERPFRQGGRAKGSTQLHGWPESSRRRTSASSALKPHGEERGVARIRVADPVGTERRYKLGSVEALTMVEAQIEKMKLEMFELGPCTDAHDLGFQIGKRFSSLIKSRVHSDLILQHQLLPFAATQQAQVILQALFNNNREKFPDYWNELVGTAAGSGVSLLEILLLNFRKEIVPFIPDDIPAAVATTSNSELDDPSSDCSDILVLDDNVAMVAHNEDANIALIGHTYLVKVALPDGHSFTAYTYAGELPSCAFGFNSHGMAFTLDSVPPLKEEIQVGGIGRNLISRDLLEATSLEDSIRRIRSCNMSVGHSYNLVDVRTREIANVEAASRHRVSVRMIGKDPFFHANMYLHLQVQQVQDDNSISRHKRAAFLSANSEEEILTLLGDSEDSTYPIYMRGPKLFTLCTAVIDLDKRMLFIIHGNPEERVVSHKLPIL